MRVVRVDLLRVGIDALLEAPCLRGGVGAELIEERLETGEKGSASVAMTRSGCSIGVNRDGTARSFPHSWITLDTRRSSVSEWRLNIRD